MTLKVARGLPSMREQAMGAIVKRALNAQREGLELRGAKHFQVVHFTIQSDHLHLIVEAPDKRGLARGLAGLEVRIARGLNRLLHRTGRFWKERYHRHDLRTKTETRNVLRYVLLNSQKHERVIGDRAFADPHSSAASFNGFAVPVWVFPDDEPWSAVTPRTWLLRVGWRHHGLLDPGDLPAAAPHRDRDAR